MALIAAVLVPIEILPVHILIRHWSVPAAWFATVLSFYGLMWCIGVARSVCLRPVLVRESSLQLRLGILWDVNIPRQKIRSIERVGVPPEDIARTTLFLARPGRAQWSVSLNEPVNAYGPLGRCRSVDRIVFAVDDPHSFEDGIRTFLPESR
jgi:hypothetical protein